jgi:hypothetical protein
VLQFLFVCITYYLALAMAQFSVFAYNAVDPPSVVSITVHFYTAMCIYSASITLCLRRNLSSVPKYLSGSTRACWM